MKYIVATLMTLVLSTCSYKNIGEYGPNTSVIKYEDLPNKVQTAYKAEFDALKYRSVFSPVELLNLDSEEVRFSYIKSTSMEIIRPGKNLYRIGRKRFYLPWNANRELHPRVLFQKKIYMIYATTEDERINYDIDNNFKTMRYLKVDLSKHLNY